MSAFLFSYRFKPSVGTARPREGQEWLLGAISLMAFWCTMELQENNEAARQFTYYCYAHCDVYMKCCFLREKITIVALVLESVTTVQSAVFPLFTEKGGLRCLLHSSTATYAVYLVERHLFATITLGNKGSLALLPRRQSHTQSKTSRFAIYKRFVFLSYSLFCISDHQMFRILACRRKPLLSAHRHGRMGQSCHKRKQVLRRLLVQLTAGYGLLQSFLRPS